MSRFRRLLIALFVNIALVIAQVLGGLLTHSAGLIADAGHNAVDVAGLGLAAFAAHLVALPPTQQRSYGNHRSSILAALVNAALLTLITAGIIALGVDRLINPQDVRGGGVALIATVAVVLNAISALVVRDLGHDLNMKGALLHLIADVAAAAVVALGGLMIFVFGQGVDRVDPVASLVIGVIILIEAVKLLRQSVEILLESTPPDIDVGNLAAEVSALSEVETIHDIHVWSLSSEYRALSAHLVVVGHPSLEDAQSVANEVRKLLAERFTLSHCTLELECEECESALDPSLHSPLH
jgi:cobalt-zinc-cadmium efflux system protein